MKPISLSAFLLPAALVAAAPKTSGLCTKSSSIVTALQNPTGSSYCASLLKIPQSTSTSVVTDSHLVVTHIETERVTSRTATVVKTRTKRTTTRSTTATTVQSTASTQVTSAAYSATSIDCISDLDQLKPYTTTLSDDTEVVTIESREHADEPAALEKRAAAPSALKGQSRRRRKAFCSCMGLTSGTTTVTSTSTLPRSTVTSTTTSMIGGKTISRAVTTRTITNIQTRTVTLDPTTSTDTVVIVTPTPASYPGLAYYAYHNDYNYGAQDPGFDATTWQSDNYKQSGIIQDINDEHTIDYPGGNSACSLPAGEYDDCTQVTFVNQGYFHAIADGTYTVASDDRIDNGMYVWSGDNAYSGYSNQNWDYSAERKGSLTITTGSYSYQLKAGDLKPFTIMAVNGGGPGRAIISVTTPDGTSSGTNGFFVPACPANSPFAP